jgi:hypothetical protein
MDTTERLIMTESNGKCLFELEGYCVSWIDYPDFKCEFYLDPKPGDSCGMCNAQDSDLMTDEEWLEYEKNKSKTIGELK